MNKSIDEKFNKEFPNKIARVIDDFGDDTKDKIKQFYNKEIAKLLEDIIGEELYIPDVDEIIEYEDVIKEGKNRKRQEIIDKINKSTFKDLIK